MQAVILAGGLGTRLLPLTTVLPKPMVEVAGAPYLEHQLQLLRKQSILDVVLLTGYLGEQIESYFGDGSRLKMQIRYSREEKPLGTGGALRDARPMLAETFLLIYGDSYLPIDYWSAFDRLIDTESQGMVVAYDNREDTSVKNNIALDDAGFVAVYEKDSKLHLPYVEAGVLAFRKSCLDLMRPAGVVSLEKELFPLLIQKRQLAAHITKQRFYDIGTPERLKTIEELLAHDHHANAVPN